MSTVYYFDLLICELFMFLSFLRFNRKRLPMTILVSILLFSPYTHATDKIDDIKIGIVLPAPASRIHKHWQPFINYLSEESGLKLKIVIPRGLDNVSIALKKKELDFVYVNSYLYHLLQKKGLAKALVQMKNMGDSIYSVGRVLIKAKSNIKKPEDLKGKHIALISDLGAGSYLAPRAYLRDHKIKVESDTQITYTKNLKKAAYMVLHGDADAAVMCSVNYNLLTTKINTGELDILDSTAQFPESVIAYRSDLNKDLINKIELALSALHTTKAQNSLRPLNDMKIKTFVPYDPGVENVIKDLIHKSGL